MITFSVSDISIPASTVQCRQAPVEVYVCVCLQLSRDCKVEVQRILHQRALDVKLEPELQKRCMTDLGKWCSEKTDTGQVRRTHTATAADASFYFNPALDLQAPSGGCWFIITAHLTPRCVRLKKKITLQILIMYILTADHCQHPVCVCVRAFRSWSVCRIIWRTWCQPAGRLWAT